MNKEIIKKLENALYDTFLDLDSLKVAISNRRASLKEISNKTQDFEKLESLICKLKDFDLEKFKSTFKNLEKAIEESFSAVVQEKLNHK